MTRITFKKVLETAAEDLNNNTLLENPERLKFKSLWQRIIHCKKKNKLEKADYQRVFSFFQKRYGFKEEAIVFKRIWDKVGAKIWTVQKKLTAGIIREIDASFRKELIYHGNGIHASEYPRPEDKTVQKLVRALLHGGSFSKRMVDQTVIKAIFISQDKNLMQEFHQELQKELNQLAANPPENEQKELVWRAFLGNVIALLPFCYPASGDSLTIPVLEGGVCRPLKYTIEVLPLSYNNYTTPMPALGLTCPDNPLAPCILSFPGSTYPAASGFTASLLADFTPGKSVGEIIFQRNQEKINQWIADKKNIHVVGMSLGGSMAFHTLRHHQRITRLDAYNPPGLYQNNWTKGVGNTCKVNIYCQPGDFVSQLGHWPIGDNISLYTIYPHQKGLSENPISAHARAFTGCDKITVIKEDPLKINQSYGRYLLTKLHQFIGPFAVYLPVSCTMFFYRITKSVHEVGMYCFKKIRSIGKHGSSQ